MYHILIVHSTLYRNIFSIFKKCLKSYLKFNTTFVSPLSRFLLPFHLPLLNKYEKLITDNCHRLCREISFKFRTKLPHGLLVYHSVKDRPESLDPYALYVIVEKGQLKVVHVFGKRSTSVTVGEGLNRDEWHSVLVRIDVHRSKLIARVDGTQEETTLEVLERIANYGVSEELASVVLIGGNA